MGDYQARFCERLRVKFPLPTRLLNVSAHNILSFKHKSILTLAKWFLLEKYDLGYNRREKLGA